MLREMSSCQVPVSSDLHPSAAAAAHQWAIVLAGGSGRRLSEWTTDARGNEVPKQYHSLAGGDSLLGDALGRA